MCTPFTLRMNFSNVQMICIADIYDCVNVYNTLHCNVFICLYVYDMFHILLSWDSLRDLWNVYVYVHMFCVLFVCKCVLLKRLKVKGHFIGLFQHCGQLAYCVLTPNKFPHSSPEAPCMDARDLYQRRRELLPMNFASKSVIHEDSLGFFTCCKAGTWDILFYFPSEGRHTEDFPDAQKIHRLRPGLNPRTRVPVASILTTRPPKPSNVYCTVLNPIAVNKYISIIS